MIARTLLFLAGATLAGHAIAAQTAEPPARELTSPATTASALRGITSVRELGSGALVALDTAKGILLRLSAELKTEHFTELPGRHGRFLPGQADSSWLATPRGDAFLLVAPDGTVARRILVPGANPLSFTTSDDQLAIDPAGRILTLARAQGDSAGLYRIEENGNRTAVAMLRARRSRKVVIGSSPAEPDPGEEFAPIDAWTPAPDGNLYVVRSAPFHLERWSEGARQATGPVVPYAAHPATDRHKALKREEHGRNLEAGLKAVAQMLPGVAPVDPGEPRWHDPLPAVAQPRLLLGADGTLWVARYDAEADRETWDGFAPTGERVERVRLLAGAQLVGVGRQRLYVAGADGLGAFDRTRQ